MFKKSIFNKILIYNTFYQLIVKNQKKTNTNNNKNNNNDNDNNKNKHKDKDKGKGKDEKTDPFKEPFEQNNSVSIFIYLKRIAL